MNLTFGICWIDDQADEAEQSAVKLAVRNSGFEPDIHPVTTEQEITGFGQRQERFQDFELILLDLMLGDGLRGDNLAPAVRSSFRSTPILFYSAESETTLRQKMAKANIDGVYCAHRRDLAIRVGALVADLSPSLNRLSGMRGLAAGVVAECDQEFRTILRHVARARGEERKIVASLKNSVGSSKNRQMDKLKRIDSLEDLLQQHMVTSAILFQEVRKCVDDKHWGDEILAIRGQTKSYQKEVLESRNLLAHVLEEREEQGWRIVPTGNSDGITVDDFQAIRADLLRHLGQVRRLRQLVVGKESG